MVALLKGRDASAAEFAADLVAGQPWRCLWRGPCLAPILLALSPKKHQFAVPPPPGEEQPKKKRRGRMPTGTARCVSRHALKALVEFLTVPPPTEAEVRAAPLCLCRRCRRRRRGCH